MPPLHQFVCSGSLAPILVLPAHFTTVPKVRCVPNVCCAVCAAHHDVIISIRIVAVIVVFLDRDKDIIAVMVDFLERDEDNMFRLD